MKKLFVIAVLAIFTNAAFAATSIHAEVKGMVCAFCAKGINKKLRELESTQDVWVDLKSRIVVVELKDQKTMSLEAFTKLIKDAGYDVANVQYINKTLLEIKADHTHISNEVKK
jgi:mercuric ion binding protein